MQACICALHLLPVDRQVSMEPVWEANKPLRSEFQRSRKQTPLY
jgi:hypothetical protein